MTVKLIPDSITHFETTKIEMAGHHALTISLYKTLGEGRHPIAELPAMLSADIPRPDIDAVIDIIRAKRSESRNKYDREIAPGLWVDVYDVLDAFKVTRSAVAHAVKKLLAPGQRGVKTEIDDLKEARDSIDRAIQKLDEWV